MKKIFGSVFLVLIVLCVSAHGATSEPVSNRIRGAAEKKGSFGGFSSKLQEGTLKVVSHEEQQITRNTTAKRIAQKSRNHNIVESDSIIFKITEFFQDAISSLNNLVRRQPKLEFEEASLLENSEIEGIKLPYIIIDSETEKPIVTNKNHHHKQNETSRGQSSK